MASTKTGTTASQAIAQFLPKSAAELVMAQHERDFARKKAEIAIAQADMKFQSKVGKVATQGEALRAQRDAEEAGAEPPPIPEPTQINMRNPSAPIMQDASGYGATLANAGPGGAVGGAAAQGALQAMQGNGPTQEPVTMQPPNVPQWNVGGQVTNTSRLVQSFPGIYRDVPRTVTQVQVQPNTLSAYEAGRLGQIESKGMAEAVDKQLNQLAFAMENPQSPADAAFLEGQFKALPYEYQERVRMLMAVNATHRAQTEPLERTGLGANPVLVPRSAAAGMLGWDDKPVTNIDARSFAYLGEKPTTATITDLQGRVIDATDGLRELTRNIEEIRPEDMTYTGALKRGAHTITSKALGGESAPAQWLGGEDAVRSKVAMKNAYDTFNNALNRFGGKVLPPNEIERKRLSEPNPDDDYDTYMAVAQSRTKELKSRIALYSMFARGGFGDPTISAVMRDPLNAGLDYRSVMQQVPDSHVQKVMREWEDRRINELTDQYGKDWTMGQIEQQAAEDAEAVFYGGKDPNALPDSFGIPPKVE